MVGRRYSRDAQQATDEEQTPGQGYAGDVHHADCREMRCNHSTGVYRDDAARAAQVADPLTGRLRTGLNL
jgi:hypothetical protein